MSDRSDDHSSGVDVATSAFHQHERVTVNYQLNGKSLEATMLIAEACMTSGGQKNYVTGIWAVASGSKSESPLPIATHQYLLRHFISQNKDDSDLCFVSKQGLLRLIGSPENLHPELNDINRALIVEAPSGHSAFEKVRSFFADLNNPLDPLIINIVPGATVVKPSMEVVSVPFIKVEPLAERELNSPRVVASKVASISISMGIFKADDLKLWSKVMDQVSDVLGQSGSAVTTSHLTSLIFDAIRGDTEAVAIFDRRHTELRASLEAILPAKNKGSEFPAENQVVESA